MKDNEKELDALLDKLNDKVRKPNGTDHSKGAYAATKIKVNGVKGFIYMQDVVAYLMRLIPAVPFYKVLEDDGINYNDVSNDKNFNLKLIEPHLVNFVVVHKNG